MACLSWLAVGAPEGVLAQTTGTQDRPGAIVGVVINAGTGETLPAATVRLLELARSELSHQDGSFHFERIPPGVYHIAVQRFGFAPVERIAEVEAGDTVRVRIEVQPSAIAIPGVVVTGTGRARSAHEAYRPTSVLDNGELRRELGSSLAATLQHQPGIAQRYNGPAAAQPVIRGLSGDRVLVLEDGNRTGDIASTSADHAITIEPLTAERIEVVRGPAGLLYGSNALGGVINVVREEVPRTLPEAATGMLSLQLESVNQGASSGGSVLAALGSLAVRGELSGRVAGDTQTPLGPLQSSGVQGYNAAVGTSWIAEGGFAGVSVRDYSMEYGVPGSFQGEQIPGAHVGGVTVDLRRTVVRGEAGLLSGVGPFRSVEWSGQYTRFEQHELEREGTVGTSFGQLTATSNVMAHHRHEAGGLLSEGVIGLWSMWQDLRVAGSAGSAPARSLGAAGFAFEELGWGPLRLQLGARFDWTRISPLDRESAVLGVLRDREFSALSGSVATLVEPVRGVVLGASASRAFRTPSIPELFSSGPHLADYSFNIGNPELEAEFGTGVDLFTRVAWSRLSGELALFRNWIDNYIFYAPTGQLDPRLQRFPVYQATGDDAMLQGAEGRLQWEALPSLVMDVSGSYVEGSRTESEEPLPAIPPLRGLVGLRYNPGRFLATLGWEGAAGQDRTGEFEEPTPGYALWNAGAGLNWSAWGNLHTVTLQMRNLADEVWYDHLSRIRRVAPQPGRSVEMLYRITF